MLGQRKCGFLNIVVPGKLFLDTPFKKVLGIGIILYVIDIVRVKVGIDIIWQSVGTNFYKIVFFYTGQ